MRRFAERRAFAILAIATVSASLLLGEWATPSVRWPIVYVAMAGFGYCLLAILLSQIDNHGSGGTRRGRLQRRLARFLVGPIKPCGCWSDAGSDTVESDAYVRRSVDGVQVVLEARKRRMRRCEGCGSHYHETAASRIRNIGSERALKKIDTSGTLGIYRKVVVWPEDEPEALDHITAPVERE